MFYGLSFIFDGIASERYGLYIYSINGSGNDSSPSGNKISLLTDKIANGYKHEILGISEDEPLEFKITFGSFNSLTRHEVRAIHNWLRKNEYKKLQIVQPDMSGLHYNCIMHDSVIKHIGNVPYAFEYTVTCDSQFAWEEERTYKYPTIQDGMIRHYNDSDIPTYIRPLVKLKSSSSSNTVTIENMSNNGWVTRINNLGANEIVTIDNEDEYIGTDRRPNILQEFNHGWLELVPGMNELRITGNVVDFEITYANARRIGA